MFLTRCRHKSSVLALCFSIIAQIAGGFSGDWMPHHPLIVALPVGVKNSFSRDCAGPAGAATSCCAGGICTGQGHTGCGGASLIPNVAFSLCFSHAFVVGSCVNTPDGSSMFNPCVPLGISPALRHHRRLIFTDSGVTWWPALVTVFFYQFVEVPWGALCTR